jgi:hypothetical protein
MTVLNILGDTDRAYATQVATVATLVLWFRFLHCLTGVRLISKFVIIFVRMVKSVAVLASVLLIFVCGNAMSLEMSFPEVSDLTIFNMSMSSNNDNDIQSWMRSREGHQSDIDENFGSPAASLFTSFNMLLQAFDSSLLQNAYDPWLARICYVLYASMAHIVVLNMMVRSDTLVRMYSIMNKYIIIYYLKMRCVNTATDCTNV